jgi:signal transduction histidine kinase
LPEVKTNIYAVIWTVAGISAAFFTGVLVFIDYAIRREIFITLFGLLLFVSVAIDIYYLFVLNNIAFTQQISQPYIYQIWLFSRMFYVLGLFFGTLAYLRTAQYIKQGSYQSTSLFQKFIIFVGLAAVLCFVALAYYKFSVRLWVVSPFGVDIDLISLIPILLIAYWLVFLLPKVIAHVDTIFNRLLVLSVMPFIFAQVFMALSRQAADVYANGAHYLRFISYLVPVVGIILNYLETVKSEQQALAKLDTEINENKMLTASLQDREALLASAETIANMGSWELEIDTNAYIWSKQMYSLFGFQEGSFRPTHALVEQLVAPEYVAKYNNELFGAVRNKSNFSIEYQIVKNNGERRDVLGQGFFSSEKNRLIGTIQDITELKQATQKLRQSEGLLRESEALAHNGSWEWQSASQYFYWSEEMYNIHGLLPFSTFITINSLLQYIHPDDVYRVRRTFANARRNKSSFTVNYRIVRPNGEVRFVFSTAKAKVDKTLAGVSYVGNTQDVTVVRETERRLEEIINELNMSNKELEQFAYVASHDLQEPLRKIRAFGDRLQSKYSEKLDDEGQDYIQRMQNAAERMQILIDDLLAFSRATRETRVFVPVNMGALLNRIVTDMDYTIETAGAKVDLQVDVEIDGIAAQLAQVFQNLISNALKFTRPDVPPHIVVSHRLCLGTEFDNPVVQAEQYYCAIEVRDNGIGFDEAYADKIFDLFQRLHGKNEYKGTGIGLAICKKIIDNHNGFILARSKENEGASFTVVLPLKQNA